jgi:hypothetical protein
MGKSSELFMQVRQEADTQAGITFEHLTDAKKVNISNAVKAIEQEVANGNVDSLKALILAVKGKALFTDLEKAIRPLTENNYLDKLEKGYSAHDVSIEQSATKTEYDYSVCNDPEWNNLEALNEANAKLQKLRETFLKSLTKKMEVVDTDTGATYTIYPPNKLQKQGLKLTIK